MATDWREVSLGDIAEIYDGPHATPRKTDDGPIFLGISNLSNGRIDLTGAEHLSEKDFVTWTRRIEPKRGDVVFSYETRLGEAASIPSDLRCCLGRRMGLLRAKPGRVDERFLLYAYLGPEFQATLESRTVPGSTVDRIPLIEMPKFPIKIPGEISEQRAIAHILGTLDDKIELNGRMNETLQAMARATFLDWLQQRSSAWSRSRVSDLIDSGIIVVGDGYRAKNDEMGLPGLPFIRAGELNNGFDTQGADTLHEDSLPAARDKLSETGDIAFTSKGTIGRFARVTPQTPQFVYSPQVCFWRSVDHTRLRPSILYLWMVSDDLKGQINAVAGQTDMAPYVSLRDQRAMKIPSFDDTQHIVADGIDPMLELQDLNLAATKTLAALRDTLLPKLISGEVRIEDVEKFASATGC